MVKRNYKHQIRTILTTVILISSIGHCIAQNAQIVNITLDKLYELADKNSKAIQLSESKILEAEQQIKQAKTSRQPDINFSATAAYLSNAQIIGLDALESGNYESPHFYNAYSIDAAYVIYAGGNINRSIQISEIQKEIENLNFLNTKMDIRLMLTGNYLDLFVVQNQVTVLEKNIEQTKILIENMKSRLEAGTLLSSDLTRYELRLSNLEFSLVKAHNKKDKLNHTMVEMLDFESNTQLVAISNEDSLAYNIIYETNTSVDNNNDIKLAQLQNDIAVKNLKINKSNLYPTLALFATNNCNRPYIYELEPIDIYANVWMVGAKLSFNFGNLYKNKSAVSQAKVQLNESQTHLKLVQEETNIELHNAIVDYNEAIEQLTVAKKEIELATENYDMIIKQYNNQLALITDVMDASNVKLNSELQLENAKTAIVFAECKVKRILGTL